MAQNWGHGPYGLFSSGDVNMWVLQNVYIFIVNVNKIETNRKHNEGDTPFA